MKDLFSEMKYSYGENKVIFVVKCDYLLIAKKIIYSKQIKYAVN